MRNSKIVRTYHPDATTGWDTVNQEPVDMMVHRAIRELTGIGDTSMAWKSLFPGLTVEKKVGIKINLACGDVPTHPEVVNSIIDGLLMIDLDGQQLPEEHIYVWDADNQFFCAQTGYQQNFGGPGVQYVGTNHPSVGYDESLVFTIDHPPARSQTTHHPSKIISQFCDYLINAAVIKDHNDSGVTLDLKNTYGSFDGIPVWEMHQSAQWGDGHTRGEPELNRVLRDELGDKTKLFMIDATYGLYDGGPGYTPPWHTPPNWIYNSVLVGFDPVACDRIGTEKINEERANPEHEVLPPYDPSHIHAAAGPPYNLGTDLLEEIDLVEIDASDPAGIADNSLGPRGVALLSAYPNPARGRCTVRFHCAAEVNAEIVITDVSGAVVRRFGEARCGPGLHRFRWDGKNQSGRMLPSGTYFCRLRSPGVVRMERIVLIH
jgi:uncharacterized protein (DUF362 family)